MEFLRLATQRNGPRVIASASQQVRGMATEKQIFMQIKATKNIRKITASMKMVSAAKLKGDENRLAVAKKFNSWTSALSPQAVSIEKASYEELPQKTLLVPFTTDRGLCGGVNSFISRAVKDCVRKLSAQGKEVDIVIVGDKGRAQLRRVVGEKILRSTTDIVTPGNFALASALASELIATGAADYDAIVLMYNSFVNAATYKQVYKVLSPLGEDSAASDALAVYEYDQEKGEFTQDMYEFMLTSQIFGSLMDSATSEQSSRMTAMENASKNAGEMIHSLTLRYNRARQARITTELIEIISGSAALDDGK